MIKGAAWIMLFYFLGECVSSFIGRLLPGSVCGMILLFLALSAKLVNPDDVRDVSRTLTQNMALFFVPAGVGLMASYDLIARYWMALLLVTVATTAVVIAVVGLTQDKLEKKI